MKASTGYVFKQGKRWIARLTFTTPEGKRKNLTRNADTKTEASEALDHLRRTLKDYGQKPLDGEKLTVKYLCDKYVEAKIKPAEYHQERKVAGRRSWRSPLGYVKTIKASFGHRKIKSLTPSDLEAFKLARLKTPTIRGTERSITSVNRELETMRSMFVFAKHQGWLLISPFEQSSGLISKADEKRRDRHLTMTDEAGLMAASWGTAGLTTRRGFGGTSRRTGGRTLG